MERRLEVDTLLVSTLDYTRDCDIYWGSEEDAKTDRGLFRKAHKRKGDAARFFYNVASRLETEVIKKGDNLWWTYKAWGKKRVFNIDS
jgi:hypothetical protein